MRGWSGVVAWLLLLVPAAGADELPMGPWQQTAAGHRIEAGSRALCYLLDQPYCNAEGTVATTITVSRRLGRGGWACAAVLISPEPSSFWTLSLVDGPDDQRYCELIESYQGVHQAQGSGPYRLVPLEGTRTAAWEYGRTYRLRLVLTADTVRGTITDTGSGAVIADLGYRLQGAPALREGWAVLRAEQCAAEFGAVEVTAPAATSAAATISAAQGPSGGAGLYLGEDLPGAEPAPDVAPLREALRTRGLALTRLRSVDLRGSLPYPALRVLFADLRRCPADALPNLFAWLRAGGLLVSLAAPGFQQFYWPDGERWLDEGAHSQQQLTGLGRDVRPVVTWSPAMLPGWRQGYAGKARPAAAQVEAGAPDQQSGLTLRVPHFDGGWWVYSHTFDAPPARAGETLTCFWARGDERTAELSLEWTERDGSRWIAVVPLGATWRYYVLPPQAFSFWSDSKARGRGQPGDQLNPAQAVGLHFGLSNSHTPGVLSADAAEHRVQLGAIGFAKAEPAALARLRPPARPDLEALSPGYKLHPIEAAARWVPTEDGRRWGLSAPLPAPAALAAVERPTGSGFDRGRWWRWIPLLQATDAAGQPLGSPLSVVVSEMLPYARCTWVSLGLRRLADLREPALQQALAAVAIRLVTAPVLFEAGATHYRVRSRETVNVGAKVAGPAGDSEVRFRVDGREVARRPVALTARQQVTVRADLPAPAVGDHRLLAELWSAGHLIDQIVQPLTVQPPRTAVDPSEVVRRHGGRLLLAGQPWHPRGCNYWAHNLGGLSAAAYGFNWLSPGFYQPELVEADLAQLHRWGVNALAAVGADVGYGHRDDNPTLRNLEDFLDRCQRQAIKVILFVPGLDPRGRDDEKASGVIRAVRYHPALAGYDIAWEPGYFEQRRLYTANWPTWLAQQYGSVEAAEQALGHALPRLNGAIDQPPDEWLTHGGPWAAVQAAYRRFMSWQLGADYRRSVALVRSLDPDHLVGFRGSNVVSPLGFKPVEQPGVLHFVDWAGPEGYDVAAYGRLTDWPQVSNRGLCTRTLAYLSGGKPVIWMEFGMPVYPNGTPWADALAEVAPSRLQYQVDEADRWYRMMVESGTWGTFPWWYPGGFRVGENSDCGLVDPANRPRPVVEVMRRYHARLAESERFTPDAWLEFTPERNPGGWIGEYLDRRDEYARLVAAGHRVGVRTKGDGTTAAQAPLVDPAGRPWPGRGPLRYLDAMFERVRLRRGGDWVEVPLPVAPGAVEVTVPGTGPLELEAWVGNLAEARWLRGGVLLTVSGDASGTLNLAADTPFQGSGHFAPATVSAGRLRLQVEAPGRARFGEVLELVVR